MYDLTLTGLRGCISQEDTKGALQLLRTALNSELMQPRDAVELMLVVRDGTREQMLEAIAKLRGGVPGCYRYIPVADYAYA
jgi:hypothetical protein